MPVTERKRKDRVRNLRWVCVCVAVLLVGLYFRQRAMPENLGEWKGGIVVGGWCYRAEGAIAPGRGVLSTITARSVRGNDVRVLAKWSAASNVPRANLTELMAVRGPWLYCLVLDDPASLRAATVFGPPMRANTRTPGKSAGAKRQADRVQAGTVVRKWVETSPPYSLMRIPIAGGTPERLAVVRDFVGFATNTAYWLDVRRAWTVTRVSGRQPASRVDGVCRLMATSLTDGKTRVAATGLPALPGISGGEQGVAWSTPISGSRQTVDLHVLREGEAAPIVIRDVPTNATGWAPTLCGSRFYWAEHESTAIATGMNASLGGPVSVTSVGLPGRGIVQGTAFDPNAAPVYVVGSSNLMSAAADGSDTRVALTAPILHLYLHKGRIYVLLGRDSETNAPGGLMRLHPETGNSLERVAVLPHTTTGVIFDGDSVYFTAQEQRRTWMERLTGDGSRYDTVQTLYRLRLSN